MRERGDGKTFQAGIEMAYVEMRSLLAALEDGWHGGLRWVGPDVKWKKGC